MLIVIVIIGILAAALIPRLTGVRERAYDINMEKSVRDLQHALMLYHIDHGEYPGESETASDTNGCHPYDSTNPNCRHHAASCTNLPNPQGFERRKSLINDLSPYIQDNFEMTTQKWPHCIFYMTPHFGGYCEDKGKGYELVFVTKKTQLTQHIQSKEFIHGNNNGFRYCVYPLE